jgi:photosystem II stability/assembly factor-like uncharacterized protein
MPRLSVNKKFVVWSSALSLLCILGFQIPAPAEWQKPVQPSMSGGALTCLASHPLDVSKFLIASGQQVFEAGKENAWQPLWSQSGASAPIRRLFSFAALPEIVFAITDRNVFMGNLQDRSWRAIYKDSGKTPLAFAVHPRDPNRWLLGTQKGLRETMNAGKTWSTSRAFLGSHPVPLVLFEGNRLFIATENALFLSLGGEAAQQVFTLPQTSGEPSETASDDASAETPFYLFKIHDLLVSKRNPQTLFLATANGAFQSLDGGHRWEPLPQSGLQSAAILQLAYSEKKDLLYAATSRGVYAYDSRTQKWTGLFEGLARNRAQSIAVLNEERLLAITGEGFVQYPLGPFTPEAGPALAIYQPPEETLALFKELLALEPSAREIQQRVIQYANVANGKIKRWHAESRLAGFLPTFSFGKNLDRSASISTYSGKYITGPEDVSRGWDAGVDWDLGDMIYSPDQASIDSREKLMVELRDDLLSEATRIYYERRRLQIDLVFTPPVSRQEHLENLLRVDELTALLDGMTDGFFSKRLERTYQERPAFDKLWAFSPEGVRSTGYGDEQQNKGV